jgi:hypothetical protein
MTSVAEQLDHLEHLLVFEALVGEAEHELVTADLLVLGDLLVEPRSGLPHSR